jgi:PAS domain S-box-containing protein
MSSDGATLRERYAEALGAYLAAPDEAGRESAYELGREAIAGGLGVLDVSNMHSQALALDGIRAVGTVETQLRNAWEFFTEAIAPFEMALRGFREANATLHRLASTLEERIAERTSTLRATEQSLLEKTRVLQGILEGMPDAVAVAGPDGALSALNPAGERLTGPWQMFQPDEETPLPEQQSPISRALRGEETQALELFLKTGASDEGVHVSISASPLRDAREVSRGAVVVARDITARRKNEEAVRRAEDRLRQSQKMDAIGQLAGGVAHDFNNLLAVITSYAELAFHALPDDHEARDDLLQITSAARSAASLTRQLLAFSRRQVLQTTVLDLNGVISDVERMLRRTIGEHISLATHLDPELGRVIADRGQIEQIVMNLAVNARDAMPTGGRLMIETSNTVLTATTIAGSDDGKAGRYAVLAVTDTGVGMDDDTKARIFEPFFTTKGVGQGTGLGLATVYGIVRQSGGHVWVYSEPGHGSTFKVYLPFAPAQVIPDVHAAGVAHAGGTERILLVEDADPLRQVAARILRAAGYDVLEARDPAEARRLAAEAPVPIDLLLTDVVMPGGSGPDLASELLLSHPGLRVLLMSGYAGAGATHGGAVPPQSQFLEKPFTPESLRTRVRQVLDGPAAGS